jgi:hypothetical protein
MLLYLIYVINTYETEYTFPCVARLSNCVILYIMLLQGQINSELHIVHYDYISPLDGPYRIETCTRL